MQKLREYLKWLKTPRGLASLAGVLLLLWLVAGLFSPRVDAVWVERGTAIDAVTGTVKVRAAKETVVTVQVEGRLATIEPLDASGKLTLRTGQVFAQQDTSALDLEIALYASREKILKDQIAIGTNSELAIIDARADMKIVESLFAAGQFSKADLERKKRDLEKLERDWQKERLDLERDLADATYELQTRIDKRLKMSLVSPIDGDMCATYAVEGQVLAAEAAVAMIRSRELSIEVSLAEEDFAGVAVGQRATCTFTGMPGIFKGKVSALAAYSNPETRRRSVFVTLDSQNAGIVPGSTGYATIIKAERRDAVIVPRRALSGNDIYTVELGYLRKHRVALGYQSFETVEIRSGVGPGSKVALAGSTELVDGQRVHTRTIKP